MSLNEKLADLRKKDDAFWAEAFTNPVTKRPYTIPDDIREAAISVCRAYGIRGICDPMYIANTIAQKLGRGDGQSNFN